MNRMSRLLLVALAGLLLVSLALNVVLFGRARQYYFDLNAVRLNPIDLDAYADVVSAPVTEPRFVFFGDSRAARWPVEAASDRFEVINRGVEAETSAQAALRFSAHVAPLHPDVLLVQVGVNDLKTIPLFPDRKADIIAVTKQNIRQIVAQATALGARVILTTIFPVGDFPVERRLFWSPDIESAIEDVNAELRSAAAENISVLDAATILTKDGRANLAYYLDELHLNEAGYAALNRELATLLDKLD